MLARLLRSLFAETHILRTLFGIALVAHLAVFFALLSIYGPCSFFLSNDCTLNGNDTQLYVIDAFNLTHGHGYSRFVDAPYEPDAMRTPLLPLYFAPFALAGGYSSIWLAILLLNIVLSLAPLVIYKLARFFVPHGYAAVAGVFLALEPLYLYRSQIAEPDALFVLLTVTAMYFLVRSWKESRALDLYLAFGILGLSILAKPTSQYLLVIALAFHMLNVFVFKRESWRMYLKHTALALVLVLAILSPWLVRNHAVFGVWGISSVSGAALYEFYTNDIALPGEQVPLSIQEGSREPSRYLPYQNYFTHVAFARIEAHPIAYMREQLVGSLRNLFVSDISSIIYYGHTKILPFPYNPESGTSLHALLSAGDISGFFSAFRSVLPKFMWTGTLFLMYVVALFGWATAWRRDGKTFFIFALFFAVYAYLVVASGPYVEAKYRLPAMPLIIIVTLYGLDVLLPKMRVLVGMSLSEKHADDLKMRRAMSAGSARE